MNEVFEIASSNARWGFMALGLIPLLIGLGLIASGLNTPKLEITGAGLRLSGELYGRFISTSELRLEQSRLVTSVSNRTWPQSYARSARVYRVTTPAGIGCAMVKRHFCT